MSRLLHRLTSMSRIAVLAAASLGPSLVDASGLSFVPEAPREFEPMAAIYARPSCTRTDRVEHVDGRIRIVLEGIPCIFEPSMPQAHVSLGRLPAGSYRVDLVSPTGDVMATNALAVRRSTLEIESASSELPHGPRLDLSGNWRDPAHAGHGVFIEHSSDGKAFVVFNTYEADGEPTFRIMTLDVEGDRRSRLPLLGESFKVTQSNGQPDYEQVGVALLLQDEAGALKLVVAEAGGTRTLVLQRINL